MNRPVATLFMLMSVDGKIGTGATDELDVDQDFPQIDGLREGLHQYYEIEQTTDLWSFNTGRVQAKMGVNTKPIPEKTPVSFVLLDNHHLDEHGIRYFCARSKQFVLITTNRDHPAFRVPAENLRIIFQEKLSLAAALTILRERFGCERLTIQSGGTVNGLFLREKLFDFVEKSESLFFFFGGINEFILLFLFSFELFKLSFFVFFIVLLLLLFKEEDELFV